MNGESVLDVVGYPALCAMQITPSFDGNMVVIEESESVPNIRNTAGILRKLRVGNVSLSKPPTMKC